MSTIFSRIVSGELPCFKVAENGQFLAFLDITPLRKGHVLVIPKVEVDYIFDMEDDSLAEMMVFAKSVSRKIKHHFPCKKVGMAAIGLEVAHAHIHLIPIDALSDMDFTKPKLNLKDSELAEIAELLQH
jgi:histidine triad (HIT) family protein